MNTATTTQTTTTNTTLLLFRLNLTWHAQVMRTLLVRHKIFFILIIALLTPSLASLHQFLIWPAKALVARQASLVEIAKSLLIYQVIGIAWVMLYQSIFHEQPWKKYFLSLNLTQKQTLLNEIVLLFIFDSMLWLPLLLAGVTALYQNYAYSHHDYHFLALAFIVSKCGLNFILVLFGQLLWIKLSSYWLSKRVAVLNLLIKHLPVALRIQLKELTSQYHGKISLMVVLLGAMLCMTIFVLTRDVSTAAMMVILSVSMLVNALIISTIFPLLHTLREDYQNYFASLPGVKRYFFKIDLMIASLMLLSCNFLIGMLTLFYCESVQFLPAIGWLCVSMAFLWLSYFPQVKYKKYGFIVALVILILIGIIVLNI
ncbi:MAG TPA: hypothetical protein VHZ76_03085 [Gammaproteobacteria bacterium]|jgi:hypothetical protein|nr:hypothetical protein [Gammaproteobacteria bacterium]